MTVCHTRHIVLTVLVIAVFSASAFAQEDIAELRAQAEQGDAEAQQLLGSK